VRVPYLSVPLDVLGMRSRPAMHFRGGGVDHDLSAVHLASRMAGFEESVRVLGPQGLYGIR
jgi:hypothetical protein